MMYKNRKIITLAIVILLTILLTRFVIRSMKPWQDKITDSDVTVVMQDSTLTKLDGIYLETVTDSKDLKKAKATVDMDSDGEDELVVRYVTDTQEYYYIFKKDANKYRGYGPIQRYEFLNLKTDGTFEVSYSIYDHAVSFIKFEGSNYTINNYCHMETEIKLSETENVYYIGEEKVTEEKFNEISEGQKNKEDVIFTEFK